MALVACANYTNAAGSSSFDLIDIATGNPEVSAIGSTYTSGQPYQISLQRLPANNSVTCYRGTFQPNGPLSSSAAGPRWGVGAKLSDAAFDYVMVVGH